MFRTARSRACLIPFVACAAFLLLQFLADASTVVNGALAQEGSVFYTGNDFVWNGQTYCQGEWRSNGGLTVGDRCMTGYDPTVWTCICLDVSPTSGDWRMWSKLKVYADSCGYPGGWSPNTSSTKLSHCQTDYHPHP